MATLTAANCILMMSVAPIFPTPVQLQGFAADDVTGTDAIEAAETLMGVDGKLSGGFVNVPIRQNIALQADSPSIAFFDQWFNSQKFNQEVYAAFAVVSLPSLGKKWQCSNGFLKGYVPIPQVRRIVREQHFAIEWESVIPSPN